MEPAQPSPLLHVCRLLNAKNAEYLIVGGWAMILNSVIRATEDVDILIAPTPPPLITPTAMNSSG